MLSADNLIPGVRPIQGMIVLVICLWTIKLNGGQLSPTSHFSNDLGLDSLDTVEVVMAIEEVSLRAMTGIARF